MHVRNLHVGGYASNCYLVTDDTDTYSVVIDPSVPPPTRFDGRPAGTHLVAILLTHTHYDHMLALEAWRALGAPVCVPGGDVIGFSDPCYNVSATVFGEPTVFRQPDRLLDDGDIVVFGTSSLTMLETPGHTAGGGSYYGEGNLFCGDTLFANGGIGRQDVSGGALAPILTSLRKLLALPADTVIYPGHGEITTVARERLMHGL